MKDVQKLTFDTKVHTEARGTPDAPDPRHRNYSTSSKLQGSILLLYESCVGVPACRGPAAQVKKERG